MAQGRGVTSSRRGLLGAPTHGSGTGRNQQSSGSSTRIWVRGTGPAESSSAGVRAPRLATALSLAISFVLSVVVRSAVLGCSAASVTITRTAPDLIM